eukprot:gnl/Dysnectes_brevis/5349_a7652_446.p1 GENE.gnl/Dysnectes_brevis/5349_a7652_446~~gnl/Dysnectes_brevis/5349_a7652_446.p1  ORF type:complete len:294 (-),score=58.61 gnl/Dysnectes_brevis/5349_a7652_446:16-897(-)
MQYLRSELKIFFRDFNRNTMSSRVFRLNLKEGFEEQIVERFPTEELFIEDEEGSSSNEEECFTFDEDTIALEIHNLSPTVDITIPFALGSDDEEDRLSFAFSHLSIAGSGASIFKSNLIQRLNNIQIEAEKQTSAAQEGGAHHSISQIRNRFLSSVIDSCLSVDPFSPCCYCASPILGFAPHITSPALLQTAPLPPHSHPGQAPGRSAGVQIEAVFPVRTSAFKEVGEVTAYIPPVGTLVLPQECVFSPHFQAYHRECRIMWTDAHYQFIEAQKQQQAAAAVAAAAVVNADTK